MLSSKNKKVITSKKKY